MNSFRFQDRAVSIFALSAVALLATACSSTPKQPKCDIEDSYVRAQNLPTLTVPEGLATPDHRTALTIPTDNGKAVNPSACLQRAPTYFGTAGRIAASPEEMVADWAQAWADRNGDAVMAMYATQFSTDAPAGAAGWLAQRKSEIQSGPLPVSRVADLKVVQQGNDQRIASFTQTFGDTKVHKELVLVRDAGVWKIASEKVVTAK